MFMSHYATEVCKCPLICVSLRPEANGGYGIFIFTDKYAGRDVALPASRFWNCGIALCFRAGGLLSQPPVPPGSSVCNQSGIDSIAAAIREVIEDLGFSYE